MNFHHEYAKFERILDASESILNEANISRYEMPLRKMIVANRMYELARSEQDRLTEAYEEAEEARVRKEEEAEVCEEEEAEVREEEEAEVREEERRVIEEEERCALEEERCALEEEEREAEEEHIQLIREATDESDWWSDGEDDDSNSAVADAPSALLDAYALLEFLSAPLFIQEQPNEPDAATAPAVVTATDTTVDWSWLRDPKLLSYDGMLPYDSESIAVDDYEIAELLSEFSESDEDMDVDMEEDVVVVLVGDKQEEEETTANNNNNTAILIGKEHIAIVPVTTSTSAVVINNSNNNKKRIRQQEQEDDELPCSKRRILIRT